MKYRSLLLLLITLIISLCVPRQLHAQHSYKLHLISGSKVPQANAESFFRSKEPFHKYAFAGYHLVIVQFYRLPDALLRQKIKKLGIKLMDYMPDYAYLAAIPEALAEEQAAELGIRAVVPLSAEDKLSTEILSGEFPASALKQSGYVDVNVNVFSHVDEEKIKSELHNAGVQVLESHREFDMMMLRVPRSKVKQLAAYPWLLRAEAVSQPVLFNRPGRAGSRANVLADGVRGLNGEGMHIGFWDGGVVGPHIDFSGAGRMVQVETSYLNTSHSTHVAGTMTGAGMLDPFARGIIPKAKFYVHSIDNGQFVPFEMYQAVQNYGITITQNSYGDNPACNTGAPYKVDSRAQDQLVNLFPNLIHVFAVGNYQTWCAGGFRTTAGQAAKNTITVGAVEHYADVMTTFSSWGPLRDGRLKPDVCAVGSRVYSTLPNNGYGANGWNGTSMACPVVSGIAAQLSQRYRQLNAGADPLASLVKAVVCNTAQDLGNAGPDYKFGYGRVNALGAVRTLEENRYTVDRVAQGASKTMTVNVPVGATRLRVLLCWSDPAAAVGTSVGLVNDLDLKVTDAAATSWQPWILNPALPNSVAARGTDRLNNVEQVTIDNPAPGTYQVDVSGFNIPVGTDQQYALTWQVDATMLEVTAPIGKEKFPPNSLCTIRWNDENLGGNCTLEYSLDNGVTWTTITTTATAANRFFDWTTPNVMTGQALVRVTNGTYSDVSDEPFTIAAFPGISVTAGANSLTVNWSAVTGATGYDVFMLNTTSGAWDMLAGNHTGFSYTASGLTAGQTYWFTVRARNNSLGVVSEMGYGTRGIPLGGAVADISVEAITAPVAGCNALSSAEVISITLKNAGSAAIAAGTVIPVSYSVNGAPAVTENLVLTAPLASGASTSYSFAQTADLSGTSTNTVVVSAALPGDAVSANNRVSKSFINPVPLPLSISGNTSFCGSTTLTASGITPALRASPIAFAPVAMAGATPVTLGDDQVTDALPIGFNFSFFGRNYSEFYIGSNGLIGFDQFGIEYASTPQVMPHTDVPNNIIAMAWTDLAPNMGGSIRYMTTGTAPNRRLIVSYEDVPRWTSGAPVARITGQIVLYEASNVIEFHVTRIESDGSMPTSMGAESSTGKEGVAVSGRSNTIWSTINEGIRLEPHHPAIVWQPSGDTTPSVTVTAPGTYSFTVTENGCPHTRSAVITSNCDVTAPFVTALSPADDAIGVAVNDNLVITFDENVRVGSGNITIFGGSSPIIIPAGGGSTGTVTIAGNVVTINPTDNLLPARNYYITVDTGTFRDYATVANDFAGISAATAWNFSTLNQAPTDITLSASSVNENLPAGTLVGVLSTVDPDTGDTHSYTITGGTGSSMFAINGNQVLTTQPLDHETAAAYTLEITSTDAGNPPLSFTKTLTISINDVNELPTDITLSAFSVNENMPIGTVVGTFNTIDPDAGNTHTYTIITGSGSAVFAISGNQLVTTQVLDYEAASLYAIQVRSTDSGTPVLSLEKTFTLGVNDVNEVPTDITLSASAIDENLPAGTVVGNLSTLDPDNGNTHTYTITGGTGSSVFSISGNQVISTQPLDYEAVSSYTLTVQTSDSGTPALSFSKTFTIGVNDVNEAPTDIALSASAIDENLPAGTVVGNLLTIDPDNGNTHTYTITGGTGSGVFAISGSQVITTQPLDYETVSSYTLIVQTSDSGTPALSFSKTFTIGVNDVNEAPTDMMLSASTVNENMPAGTVVGSLSTVDPDTGSTHTYTITGGTGSSVFAISGNQVVTTQPLDYEAVSSYTLIIQTSDSGTPVLSFSRTFTIQVNDVNEAPTGLTLSASTVHENLPAGTVVGSLATVDPDAANTHTYTITGGTGSGAFAIAGNQLVTTQVLDYETMSSYTVQVQTSDSGIPVLSLSRVFTINVIDINESPTLNPVTDIQRLVNSPAFTVTLNGISPGTGENWQTVTITATSSNRALIPNPVVTYTNPSGAGSLLLSPTAGITGTSVITVTVQDNGGTAGGGVNSISRSFQVTISSMPVVIRAQQFILLDTIGEREFTPEPFALAARASSGLPVTLEVVSGPATLTSANRLVLTGTGQVKIRASQGGSMSYFPAPDVIRTFNVVKARQRIVWLTPVADKVWTDPDFAIQLMATSGLPLRLDVVSGPAVLAGNTVKLTGVGRVVLRATQEGNENYLAATPSVVTFEVGKVAQTISLENPGWKTFGDPDFNVQATSSSGLPVQLSVVSGAVTLKGNTISINGTGNVTLKAEQPGNERYLPASATVTFTILKAQQQIVFENPGTRVLGATPLLLIAKATSGLPVEFEVVSGAASLNGNQLTLSGTGQVAVRAVQRGNENYEPVESAIRVFEVLPDVFIEATLKQTTFCGGEQLSAGYTTNGVFGESNIFNLVLSDERGNFSNPVYIGSVAARTDGRITATLPRDLPAGNYRLKVVASSPYRESKESSSTIAIRSAVETPVISLAGGELVSGSSTGNQWYENGKAIAGATGRVFKPQTSGTYTVEVLNGNCTAMSLPFLYVVTGNSGIVFSNVLKVYPNPTKGVFVVELELEKSAPLALVITDVLGREVHRQQAATPAQQFRQEINLEHLPTGQYLLKVTSGDWTGIRKVVVE